MTPVRVLFIAGLGRSGTTLLERSIGEFEGVTPLGEVVHLWHRGVELNETCGCGRPFHDCPQWQAIGQEAFGGWDRLDVDRVNELRLRLDPTRQIPGMLAARPSSQMRAAVMEYRGYYAAVYQAAARVTDAKMIVDSSKHVSLAYCLRGDAHVDLRVIHVIRDPRAVAYSWTRRVPRPEARGGDDGWMVTYPPGRTALRWDGYNVALRALQATSTPVTRVRYEDFLAAPMETVRKTAHWAGLPPDSPLPVSDAGVATLTQSHSVSGNPGRFLVGEVPIVRNDQWRTELSKVQRRTVTALTLPLMGYFGYSPRSATSPRTSL